MAVEVVKKKWLRVQNVTILVVNIVAVARDLELIRIFSLLFAKAQLKRAGWVKQPPRSVRINQ